MFLDPLYLFVMIVGAIERWCFYVGESRDFKVATSSYRSWFDRS